jgi:hypothetical protein
LSALKMRAFISFAFLYSDFVAVTIISIFV